MSLLCVKINAAVICVQPDLYLFLGVFFHAFSSSYTLHELAYRLESYYFSSGNVVLETKWSEISS